MNPIKCAKKYVKLWSNDGSPDLKTMESMISEDVIFYKPLKEVRGRSQFMEFFKMHSQSFSPLHVKINSCALVSDGSVAVSWSSWGKFAKDFHDIKANGNWIHIDTCSRYYFNQDGRLTKSYDFLDPMELSFKMRGNTSIKERVCNDYFQLCNGQLNVNYVMRNYSKHVKLHNPRSKENDSIEKTLQHLESLRICAPSLKYQYECSPSSDDFNLWICCWSCNGKIDHPNPLGMPVGQEIHLKGMTTFRFDLDDLIIEQTDALDHSHFYKTK